MEEDTTATCTEVPLNSPGNISAIVLGIVLFALLLCIILKKMWTYLKGKKRKIIQGNDNNIRKPVYEVLEPDMIDQPAPVERRDEHLTEDTGIYSNLSEFGMHQQRTETVEMSLIDDSSGYTHMIVKNRKSETGVTITVGSSQDGQNEESNAYSVVEISRSPGDVL